MSQSFTATEWHSFGNGVMVRRSALEDEHPESWPSLWFNHFKEEMPNYARERVGLPPKDCQHQCPKHCPALDQNEVE